MKLQWTAAGVIAAALFSPARAQTTERVSAGCNRTTIGNAFSRHGFAALSSDGRYVVVEGTASNLVPNDTNATSDVFVWDRQYCAFDRVSVATDGSQGNGSSGDASISADGRFVAYDSAASNLAPGDTNGVADVFVYDRQSGTNELVSVGLGGAPANDISNAPSISADGRFVAFMSFASNLVPNDTNGTVDAFVRDRQTGTTERVSVDSGGAQASADDYWPAISADGRFVAFQSFATNLVAGDTNGVQDVFVHDRQTGTTERVSVDSSGAQGIGGSGLFTYVGISADGRYVTFASYASNLVGGDTNAASDVFIRDRQAGTTERVSVGGGGVQANSGSTHSAISSDGRYVAFASAATNLGPLDLNGQVDVYVRDRQAGTTELVSVSTSGAQGNADSNRPFISGDGRYVAFDSTATNFVPGDTNAETDLFVHDRSSGTTDIASATSPESDSHSDRVSMSPDGRYLAFESAATDLIPGDTNGAPDVFVRDTVNGTFDRVSVSSSGTQAAGGCEHPAISADGRFVAFDSYAGNLVAGSTSGRSDVYLRDRQAGTTEVVSLSSGGARGDSDSFRPSISADGRFVAFESNSTNLVGGDSNGVYDVFVRDRQLGTTERVSVSSGGAQGDGYSYIASISSDGRYVAFQSIADNLVAGDTNGQMDVFVRDRQLGATVRASVSSGGVQGNSQSFTPSISADGRYVAFASSASNLVGGDTNGTYDVFVRDLQGGTTVLVSAASSGAIGNGQSLLPCISSSGRFVAFYSEATNLVPSDVNGFGDIFLRDRLVGATSLASVSTGGVQENGNAGNGTADSATSPVSADGRFVAFVSGASNLVPGDTNGAVDVFLRDRGTASAFAAFCFGDGTGAACPCANNGAPGHGCENSSTTGGAVLSGSGVASLSADTVHLTASGEKPTATSVLLQGGATVNSLHYGDGLRCVGGTLKRLYTHNAVGGAVTMPQGADATISARSAASGDLIQAGSTRNYQIYYRDPSTTFCPSPSGSTFNISNAIAISWEE